MGELSFYQTLICLDNRKRTAKNVSFGHDQKYAQRIDKIYDLRTRPYKHIRILYEL